MSKFHFNEQLSPNTKHSWVWNVSFLTVSALNNVSFSCYAARDVVIILKQQTNFVYGEGHKVCTIQISHIHYLFNEFSERSSNSKKTQEQLWTNRMMKHEEKKRKNEKKMRTKQFLGMWFIWRITQQIALWIVCIYFLLGISTWCKSGE